MDEVGIAAHVFARQAELVNLGSDVRLRFPDANGNLAFIKGRKRIVLAPRAYTYVDDVFSSFDYFFGAVISKETPCGEVVDFSRPSWHQLPDRSWFFFTSLPEGEAENQQFIEVLRPRPGETVLDLGAYCGRSATTFARSVGPSGRVVSYEPDPENFLAAQINVAARCSNVAVVNKAVWGTRRSLWFSAEGNMGSRVVLDPRAVRGAAVEVQGNTLRGILEENALERCDIVKMDIEGSEYEVLERNTDLIRRMNARWLVEAHADPGFAAPDITRLRRAFDAADMMTIHLRGGTQKAIYAQARHS